MRKLALNDEILLKVENPARYIGNEGQKRGCTILHGLSGFLPDRHVPSWDPDII